MNALLSVGTRVKFLGFSTSTWDFPAVNPGTAGEIVSTRKEGQLGMDYWVLLDDGRRLGFDFKEIKAI